MTKDQVDFIHSIFTKLNNKNETATYKYRLTFDDQSVFDSGNSFVKMVPNKELAVCIRINNDHYTHLQAPFEVSTASYDKILHMEGYVNMDNLIEVVKAITDNTLSERQLLHIKKFAEQYGNNMNPAPMEDRPYFKSDPKIAGRVNLPKVRDDLKSGDTVYDQGGFDNL